MEVAHVEARAEPLLGLGAQFENRKLADLVAERLGGPGYVAQDLDGREAFGLGAFLDQKSNRLHPRPGLGMEAGVGHQSAGPQQLPGIAPDEIERLCVKAEFMTERLGVERPTFAEGREPQPAAELGYLALKLDAGLEVVSGHALVRQQRGEICARG